MKNHLISISDFTKMQKSYDDHVRIGDQTKSVWFDFESLKEYIEKIEKDSSDLNIPLSGVRVYFIAKDDAERRMNLAFCPTYRSKNEQGEDQDISFDPEFSTKDKPESLASLSSNPSTRKNTSIFNFGYPCPNHCPKDIGGNN